MCEQQMNSTQSDKKCKVILFLRTVFHGFATPFHYFIALFGCYIVLTASDEVRSNEFLRDMLNLTPLFLTNWNYAFQTLFLSLSLVCDLLEWVDKHQSGFGKKLQYWRDVIFSGLVVPFTLFISAMFWIVYNIDRELVFPEVYDQIVPWWFNHCVHTNITVVVCVETVLQARRYPRDRRMELALVAIVDMLYAIVYYSIYFLTNRWLYAVFGVMTWWQVCLYQLVIWGSAFIFYFLQFPVNRIFHREESAEEQKTTTEIKTNVIDTNGDFPDKAWSLKYSTSENSKL